MAVKVARRDSAKCPGWVSRESPWPRVVLSILGAVALNQWERSVSHCAMVSRLQIWFPNRQGIAGTHLVSWSSKVYRTADLMPFDGGEG